MSNNILAGIMFLSGCGVMVYTLLRSGKRIKRQTRRRAKEKHIDFQPRPVSQWSGTFSDASAMIDRQMVEFHETTREEMARLQTKIMVLEQLIRTSDDRIAQLESLLAETKKG